jgi:glucose-6-phosphate-specific signal transduction histidine kinase
LYAAAWLLCMALYAAGFASFGATASQAVRAAVAIVVPWAVVGLVVLRAARALPWPAEEGRTRVILLHVALALGFVVLSIGGWYVLVTLDMRLVMRTAEKFHWRAVPYQVLNSSLVYAALAGSSYARQNAARVREESARAARAELLRASAELAALRSQLNPHFILNTLHTLLGLVQRDPALAEQAIERIGDLLRYGLRLHREAIDEVTLREEWDFVRSYLDLEALRLGDRLRLRMEADESAMECRVPAFVLQPLVENAIRHAVAPRARGGRLEVEARRNGDVLRLIVADDGPGLKSASGDGGEGMGLHLLRDRLQALYGGAARLHLPVGHEGLRAQLELPVRGGDGGLR